MTSRWVGWCKQDNHDKVWMIIQISGDKHSGKYATVWGRRGKRMQAKIHEYMTAHARMRLIDSKKEKGYQHIPDQDLDSVYPEFKDDLEKTTVWALLSG